MNMNQRPDDDNRPVPTRPSAAAMRLIATLRGGGRELQIEGLPLWAAFNSDDKAWLDQVDRVTLELGDPEQWPTIYWRGETALLPPADLKEVIVGREDRDVIAGDGGASASS
jgi:hypothetical protein